MPFITQGRTNWKYILIVVILAAIVGGGILIWQRGLPEFIKFPLFKKPAISKEFTLSLNKGAKVTYEFHLSTGAEKKHEYLVYLNNIDSVSKRAEFNAVGLDFGLNCFSGNENIISLGDKFICKVTEEGGAHFKLIELSSTEAKLETWFQIGSPHPEGPFLPKDITITALSYCHEIFRETRNCPTDRCETCCGGDGTGFGCAAACCEKMCTTFQAENCPQDYCTIMINCEGKEICYNKLSEEIPTCGPASYYGQDVACCEGLVKRCGIVSSDGSCDITKGGYQDFPWCLPCGNGVCDQFENKCSCPEDCAKKKQELLLISGSFEEKYKAILFNIKTNQIESEREINNTEMTINCWAGCNNTIQISENGEIIVFYAGEAPLGLPCYECGPNLVSKLYLSPNELIFETNEDKQLFGQWILRPDGKVIYVAVPRDRHAKSPIVDLFEVSISSHEAKKIVEDIGNINAPLVLDQNQKNILSFFTKERIANNFHYYDIYSTKIDLETKSVTKELVTKDDGDSFPFFSVESLEVSPDLSKIVEIDQDLIGSVRGLWVRMINLNTHEDKKIFNVSVFSNADFIWSPDGTLLLFALSPHEAYESLQQLQQRIWLYGFRTQTSRMLIEKSGVSDIFDRAVLLEEGSFDGERFLYKTKDGKLHLFNILNNTDQTLPISDLPISSAHWIE
jgi:hypothetical protein